MLQPHRPDRGTVQRRPGDCNAAQRPLPGAEALHAALKQVTVAGCRRCRASALDRSPMCGSTRSTTSPSSSRTSRNTPCAAGCCGPKLTVKFRIDVSAMRGDAFRWPWVNTARVSEFPPRAIAGAWDPPRTGRGHAARADCGLIPFDRPGWRARARAQSPWATDRRGACRAAGASAPFADALQTVATNTSPVNGLSVG
jgi:hypothetical protein